MDEKHSPELDDEGVGIREDCCRCALNLGNDARVTAGMAVEKKAFVFLALTALREMRATPRVVSIVDSDSDNDKSTGWEWTTLSLTAEFVLPFKLRLDFYRRPVIGRCHPLLPLLATQLP